MHFYGTLDYVFYIIADRMTSDARGVKVFHLTRITNHRDGRGVCVFHAAGVACNREGRRVNVFHTAGVACNRDGRRVNVFHAAGVACHRDGRRSLRVFFCNEGQIVRFGFAARFISLVHVPTVVRATTKNRSTANIAEIISGFQFLNIPILIPQRHACLSIVGSWMSG